MKKVVRFIAITILLITAVSLSSVVKADPPNPPTVPGSHGQGGNITGAPLDGVLGVLLLFFGAAYGGWMLIDKRKQAAEEETSK